MRNPETRRRPDPYVGLPPDDALVENRRHELDLLARLERECRRRELPWARDVMGPTEAWRLHLAETDPEWDDGELEAPAQRDAADHREVAA